MDFFGMEKLSLVDFDGKVAATVFTGSCNFRCGFCHNSSLVLDVNSLKVMPTEEILEYLKKRIGILEGLCITGGEPTLNPDLPDFCEKVKNLGYAVKLDTNGTNLNMIKTLISNGLCDYFAMDIKSDKAGYPEIIGIENYDLAKVEKTVEFFLSQGNIYEFRTTLISKNHTAEVIKNIGEWIKGANKYFMQKFKDSGSCISSGLSEVDEKTAKKFLEIVKPFVANSNLRGY